MITSHFNPRSEIFLILKLYPLDLKQIYLLENYLVNIIIVVLFQTILILQYKILNVIFYKSNRTIISFTSRIQIKTINKFLNHMWHKINMKKHIIKSKIIISKITVLINLYTIILIHILCKNNLWNMILNIHLMKH